METATVDLHVDTLTEEDWGVNLAWLVMKREEAEVKSGDSSL